MFAFKLFSIRALVAPSATIFVILLYFFKIGIQESNEGPAPMMKIDSFSISFFNSVIRVFFDSNESNSLDDWTSFFFE